MSSVAAPVAAPTTAVTLIPLVVQLRAGRRALDECSRRFSNRASSATRRCLLAILFPATRISTTTTNRCISGCESGALELRPVAVLDVRRVPSMAAGYCYGSRMAYIDRVTWQPIWMDLYDSALQPVEDRPYDLQADDVSGDAWRRRHTGWRSSRRRLPLLGRTE